jgi:hypothetical protein
MALLIWGSAPNPGIYRFPARMGILLFPPKGFCLTIELPGRRIGQRRDATRAPNQVRNGWWLPSRLLFNPPLHLSNGQKLSRLWGPPQVC